MREETHVRRAVGKTVLVSTAVFFLALAAVFTGTRLAAAGRLRRIEAALSAGDADTAAQLIARLDDGELRRTYETKQEYLSATAAMESGDYRRAAELFTALGSYEDAPKLRKEALLRQSEALLDAEDPDGALRLLEEIDGYPGAKELHDRAAYQKAGALAAAGEAGESFLLYYSLGDYADAADRAMALAELITGQRDPEAALAAAEGLTPEAIRRRAQLQTMREALPRGIVAVGFAHTAALKSDGTVLACGDDSYGQCGVGEWREVIGLCAGAYHTAALLRDGTVRAVGRSAEGQCGVEGWTDIVAVTAGDYATFGLRADGTVVWCGYNDYSMLSDWTGVTAISGGSYALAGLRADGSAVFSHESGRSELMRSLAAADVSTGYSVGVRTDGAVVSAGAELSGWEDILSVSAGPSAVLGLRADGTVAAHFFRAGDELDFSSLRNVAAMASGGTHYAFVLSDGSVVVLGDGSAGQCDTGSWDLF